ncbi:MAG: prepilin-type N-terminal cleavage/methylation domain-containing protein [Candidatus Gastranaerophilales bacterium]|nr:prepilin-type N-terminal cleavage/methylation domain-containing protein [Candidatus Gastranaerophilales bacterium]
MQFMKTKKNGFSLAETMISLLIVSVIMAATLPVITVRKNTGGAGSTKWSTAANNADIYYCNGGNCNVGIGTNALGQKLSIMDGQIHLGMSSPNQTEIAKIRFAEHPSNHASSFLGAFIDYEANANKFYIGVHNTGDSNPANDIDAITILRSNGYVGILDTTPTVPLDVAGAISATGAITTTGAINAASVVSTAYSVGGTAGVSGTCSAVTVVNGIVTGCTP